MNLSSERILTTHTGSLPRPETLQAALYALDHHEPTGLKAGDYVLQVGVTNPGTGQKELSSLPFEVVQR